MPKRNLDSEADVLDLEHEVVNILNERHEKKVHIPLDLTTLQGLLAVTKKLRGGSEPRTLIIEGEKWEHPWRDWLEWLLRFATFEANAFSKALKDTCVTEVVFSNCGAADKKLIDRVTARNAKRLEEERKKRETETKQEALNMEAMKKLAQDYAAHQDRAIRNQPFTQARTVLANCRLKLSEQGKSLSEAFKVWVERFERARYVLQKASNQIGACSSDINSQKEVLVSLEEQFLCFLEGMKQTLEDEHESIKENEKASDQEYTQRATNLSITPCFEMDSESRKESRNESPRNNETPGTSRTLRSQKQCLA